MLPRLLSIVVALPIAATAALLPTQARASRPSHDAVAPPHLSPTMPNRAPSPAVQAAIEFAVPESKRTPRPGEVALGEKLFFDRGLSVDGTVSCATCHVPSKGFVDHLPTSEGVRKQRGQRNTPTVLNAALQEHQFWDGRTQTIEEQAKLPILNPIEMGQKRPEDVEAILRASPSYVADFNAVYGRLDFNVMAEAIAAYERTQIALDSPFDAYRAGDDHAIDGAAKRGLALFFGKARCADCHGANALSPLFSDQKFHNIGISARSHDFSALAKRASVAVDHEDTVQIDEMALQSDMSALGRFLVTKQRHDIGAFKTETLRNIGITAPYMHDGSLATLWDVVDHYNRGGLANPYLDGGMQALGLTEPEIDELVAFLFTLTDRRYAHVNEAARAKQTAYKKQHRNERDTPAAMGKKDHFGDVGLAARHKDTGRLGVDP